MNEKTENNPPQPVSPEEVHPLILAAARNEVDKIALLLKAGIDQDTEFKGITALWIAAQEGSYESAELLIEAGAGINFKHPSGQSILWTATSRGHTKIVRLLLSKGVLKDEISSDVSALWLAVEKNDLPTVQELLRAGCDVNLPHQSMKQTPISKAALEGYKDIVSELIKVKADVNIVDKSGATPLMAAALEGHLDVVNILLLAGAQVNAMTRVGKTALSFANKNDNAAVANTLIQAGAKADLSYSALRKKLSKYLDAVYEIYPSKYRLADIEEVKSILNNGLCVGFSLLLIALPTEQWANFYSDLLPLLAWDGSKERLQSDKKLMVLFERTLGELLWFQAGHKLFLNWNRKQKGDSLINLVTKNQKEIIFSFGFLLRKKEVESILQLILEPGKKIEIGSLTRQPHSILLARTESGAYVLFDDNSSVGAITLLSLSDVVETLCLMFEHDSSNDNSIGINFSVYEAINSPDKERYITYKSNILSTILKARLDSNELNDANNFNITALTCATFANDEETAFTLLDNGAKPCTDSEYYLSPAYIAAGNGNVRLLEKLVQSIDNLDLDASVKGFPLFVASAFGRTETVRFLVNHGVKINRCDSNGASPLAIAAQNGHLDTIIALIDGGANVNFLSRDKRSPIFMACINGHWKVVEHLAQHGADVDPKDYSIRPIDQAICNGHLSTVETLVKYGVDLFAKNSRGKTPLRMAQVASQIEIRDYINSEMLKKQSNSEASFFKGSSSLEKGKPEELTSVRSVDPSPGSPPEK